MHVIECDVPSCSALSRELIRNSHFHDSYRAPLARPELRIVEIFFALRSEERRVGKECV